MGQEGEELGEEHVGGSPGGIGEEKWGEDMVFFNVYIYKILKE